MVTLGAAAGGAATLLLEVTGVRTEEARSVAPEGGADVVVVVAFVVGVDETGPAAAVWWVPGRGATWAASTPRWGAGALFPAVATSNAMRPSDTARMTHQLGRPRATLERKPSGASGPPPDTGTGTPYARVTPGALSLRRTDGADRGHVGRKGHDGRVRSRR